MFIEIEEKLFLMQKKCAHLSIQIFSVYFQYYCYKSYQIDQIRRLSYWAATIVSVKIALTRN